MYKCYLNLMNEVGIPEDTALRMCSLYPAQAIRCDHLYGRIATGYSAEFLVLDSNRKLVTVING
jgi:N-acetylglucosamine-6-phosphate deacetylase